MINELLDEAGGFIESSDQDRFDRCEEAVNRVLQRIRRLSQEWKVGCLPLPGGLSSG